MIAISQASTQPWEQRHLQGMINQDMYLTAFYSKGSQVTKASVWKPSWSGQKTTFPGHTAINLLNEMILWSWSPNVANEGIRSEQWFSNPQLINWIKMELLTVSSWNISTMAHWWSTRVSLNRGDESLRVFSESKKM